MDYSRFTHITFDCYGTLIDWETGILNALVPLLKGQGISATAEEILRLYVAAEAAEEAEEYRPYRKVLENVQARLAAELGVTVPADQLTTLADSVGGWPPFPDTVQA